MRCAVYISVSNSNLLGEILLQREQLSEYIHKLGWNIYQCYVDVMPRTNDISPSLLQMVKDAEKKKFDIILAKESSLLARNRKIFNKIGKITESKDIQIITLEEPRKCCEA